MSDILDPTGDGATTAPVSLNDLVNVTPLTNAAPPLAAQRNQAAKVSLLADGPDSATDRYQKIMSESTQGSTDTITSDTQRIQDQTAASDTATTMNILANPNIPMEQKQAVVDNFNKAPILKDTGMIVHSNLLAKPSAGETPDAENARLTVADSFSQIYQAQAFRQGIVNAAKEDDDKTSPATHFWNAASQLIPFSSSITNDKILSDVAAHTGIKQEWWQHFDTLYRGGRPIAEMRDMVNSLPPEQQMAFAASVRDAVKNKSGMLWGTDNQAVAYSKLNDILGTGTYGNGSEFLDNTFSVLDSLGAGGIAEAGASLVKAGARLVRGGNAASTAARGAEPFVGPGGAGAGGAAEPGFQQTAESAFNPNARAKPDVTDVPFTESTNGNFKPVMDTAPPSSQLANPVPKLTAPVVAENGPKPVARLLEAPSDTAKRVSINNATVEENPASVGKIAANANPEAGKNMLNAAFQGEDDTIAQALFGTSKNDAVASAIYPQIGTSSGAVSSRINNADELIREQFKPDDGLMEILHDSSGFAFTPSERAYARANVVHDFENAEGMAHNSAMSSITSDGANQKISAVYESAGGSWSSAEQAVEQAKYALRAQGVLDSDITVLARDGLDHVPVKLEDVRGVEGDYKVRVDMNRPITASDLEDGQWDQFNVRLNALDRVPAASKFNAASNVLDAASMLDRQITGAGAIADRQTNRLHKELLKIGGDFSDRYVATKAAKGQSANARKAMIDDYIREANYNEIPLTITDLTARGFTTDEQHTLLAFRKYWDNHHFLENLSLGRSMDKQEYQIFKNANAELHARPIAKDSTLGSMYDPATDTVRAFTKQEIDDIYSKGGTIAKFRKTNTFAGADADHMVVRNTPTEYLRKIRESDQILNYKEGYYQLQYKAPKFVDLVERNAAGHETNRITHAVAGDTLEAQRFTDRMNANHTGAGRYEVRNDDRGPLTRDRDEAYHLDSATGRIAQRHRGKLLEDASGLNRLGDGSYVKNPSQVIMDTSRGIAGNIVSTPMLDVMKQRYIKNFPEFTQLDPVTHQYTFPKDLSGIVQTGEQTSSRIADARTTWHYIHNMETAKINSLDQMAKAAFNILADAEGKLATTLAAKGGKVANHAAEIAASLERGTKEMAQGSGVSGIVKGTVSTALLSLNPLRQIPVQAYQAFRTVAYNPQGWLRFAMTYNPTGWINAAAIPRLVMSYAMEAAGISAKVVHKDSKEFLDIVRRTGLLDSIDQSNMVRGTLLQAAEAGKGSIPSRIAQTSRKIGFDTGESINQLMHMAAVFDRYKRLGLDMTKRDNIDKMLSETDALTLGQTKSNDFDYQSSSMGSLLQFLQIPHKMALNYSNRAFDAATSARLFLGDMLLFGAPVAYVSGMLGKDILPPDNPELSDYIQHGVLVGTYNHVLNDIYGDKYKGVDFSALDPRAGLDGWYKLGVAVMGGGKDTGGLSTLYANSPAGSFSSNRVGSAIRATSRYFTGIDDYDQNNPTTFLTMMNEWGKLSGGWNNATKAYMMMETHKRVGQYGDQIDQDTTNFETIAQLFGLGSYSQTEIFKMSQSINKDSQAHKDEVMQNYKNIKAYYTDKFHEGNVDPEWLTGVTGAVLNKYKDDPVAQQLIYKQMQYDLVGPEQGLLTSIIRSANLPGNNDMLDQINNLPPSMEKYKPALRQVVEDMRNSHKYLEEHNKEVSK
jgi:hypothetical protein